MSSAPDVCESVCESVCDISRKICNIDPEHQNSIWYKGERVPIFSEDTCCGSDITSDRSGNREWLQRLLL